MKAFWEKYSEWIIIIALIIIAIVIIYFMGRKQGKKYTPDDVDLPPDTQPVGTDGSSLSTWNPGPITDAIAADLSEFWGSHDAQPYNDALALSNSQLVAVYNDWNHRYFNDFDQKTLIGAIQDDWTAWNYSWATATSTLVQKLKSLGLN